MDVVFYGTLLAHLWIALVAIDGFALCFAVNSIIDWAQKRKEERKKKRLDKKETKKVSETTQKHETFIV